MIPPSTDDKKTIAVLGTISTEPISTAQLLVDKDLPGTKIILVDDSDPEPAKLDVPSFDNLEEPPRHTSWIKVKNNPLARKIPQIDLQKRYSDITRNNIVVSKQFKKDRKRKNKLASKSRSKNR